jgi:hypothetical protein
MFYCQDYGDNPACLRDADEHYTMDYRDVEGGGYIYWCAHCGPIAHKMKLAIEEAFIERPGFTEEFEQAIQEAEVDRKENGN